MYVYIYIYIYGLAYMAIYICGYICIVKLSSGPSVGASKVISWASSMAVLLAKFNFDLCLSSFLPIFGHSVIIFGPGSCDQL